MEILCDICENGIDYNIDLVYHYTGMLKGSLREHVHVCGPCKVEYQLPEIDFDKIKAESK